MKKKSQPLQTKRCPVNKGGLRILHSRTRRQRKKQRVAAGSAASDLGSEVPNLGVARALIVILVLHVAAVAAIFIHNRLTSDDPVVDKSTVKPAGTTSATGAAATALPQVGQGEDYYFVATGDTYERIAEVKNVDPGALRELNNNVPLRAGRILRLPTPGGRVPGAAMAAPSTVPESLPPLQAERPRSVAESSGTAVVVDGNSELVAARARVVEESPPDSSEAVRVRPRIAAPGAVSAAAQGSSAGGGSYTVKSGDTVWSIATRNGVSQKALMELNGLSDPRKLRVGVTLTLPAK